MLMFILLLSLTKIEIGVRLPHLVVHRVFNHGFVCIYGL